MSDFGGSFYTDPVRGVRAFRVRDDGTLTGVTHRAPWEPGENVAVCDAYGIKFDAEPWLMSMIPPYFLHRPNHSMARCGCGFYAYFEGSNDYGDASRVNAVVEGYGDVHLGTRGFRASRARIVAMHLPSTAHRGTWHRFQHWLADSPVTGPLAGLSAVGFAVGIAMPLSAANLLVRIGGALLAVASLAWTFIAINAINVMLDDCGSRTPLTRELLAAIRAKYPDVAVFSTFDAMVKAYPASRAEDFQ